MNKSEHTPGPWEIAGARHIYAPGPKGANICSISEPRATTSVGYTDVELGSPDSGEAYANARLIAAVPDLLVALEDMRKYFGNPKREEWLNDVAFGEALRADERARAAIAKATGNLTGSGE